MTGELKTEEKAGWVQTIAIGRRPGRTLKRLGVLLALAAVAFVTFRYVLLPVRITGPSMQPTYADGSINFINCLAYLRHEPERGDVVGIRFSDDQAGMFVKRIVGMPGEELQFHRGNIYINGQKLAEPYLRLPSRSWESPPRKLGPQEYYVVGDNRSMAFNDHVKGGAERNRIVGKIWLRGTS